MLLRGSTSSGPDEEAATYHVGNAAAVSLNQHPLRWLRDGTFLTVAPILRRVGTLPRPEAEQRWYIFHLPTAQAK